MRSFAALLLILFAEHLHAQTWELVTPIKTLSDLAAVHQRSPLEAVTIDRSLGHVLKTTDAGDSWVRMPYYTLDKPRALVMFDDERGIIGADIGRFYRTIVGSAEVRCLTIIPGRPGFQSMGVSNTGRVRRRPARTTSTR